MVCNEIPTVCRVTRREESTVTHVTELPNDRTTEVNGTKLLLLTSGATFMAFLDTTVVNIAFPALHSSYPAISLASLSWVVSGFAIAFAALLAPAGRLADVLGRRQVFLVSVAVFTAASLACAVAPNFGVLLGARVVQGIGAAGMIPAALGLLLAEMPPARLLSAIGIWGASGSMAAAAGPSLGGLLIAASSWRAVFLLNLPIGALILLGGWRAVPARPGAGPWQGRPGGLPDGVGTAAATFGIAGVVLGLTKGGDWGWGAPSTVAAMVIGLALVIVAVARSRRHPVPAIPVSLWSSRTFAVANLTSLLAGAALYAWLLAGPLYLTTFWGYSVLRAGLAVTPGALTSAIAAIMVGKRVKLELQPAVVAGALVAFAAVGIWIWAGLGLQPAFLAVWLPAGLIGGAAFGAALTGLSTAAAISVPPAHFAGGMALNTAARQIGGALGVAAMAAIATAETGTYALRDVFLFAGLSSFAAGLIGLRLLPRRAKPAGGQPPGAAAPEAEAAAVPQPRTVPEEPLTAKEAGNA
jgi:EmrB/QacA subfamily drug resistance transporter